MYEIILLEDKTHSLTRKPGLMLDMSASAPVCACLASLAGSILVLSSPYLVLSIVCRG